MYFFDSSAEKAADALVKTHRKFTGSLPREPIRATHEVCPMQAKKLIFDFENFCVTIIVQSKTPPQPDNDNDQYEYWSDELKSLYDSYLEK